MLRTLTTVPGDTDTTAAKTKTATPRRLPRKIRTLTFEDRVAVFGATLSSFALVEIGYYHVLNTNGLVGFLICWYFAFLLIYGGVLAMSNGRPIVVERLVTATVYVIAALVVFALGSTVIYTFFEGWHALVHTNFFTHDMSGVSPLASLNQGGIFHAIVGTVIEVGIAVIVSVPLGFGTAVYMSEVGGRWSKLVRTVVEAMTALPEILAGLFVYVTLRVRDPHRRLRATQVWPRRLGGHVRDDDPDHRPSRRSGAPHSAKRTAGSQQCAGGIALENGAQGRAAECASRLGYGHDPGDRSRDWRNGDRAHHLGCFKFLDLQPNAEPYELLAVVHLRGLHDSRADSRDAGLRCRQRAADDGAAAFRNHALCV
jgi:hypothetical protein